MTAAISWALGKADPATEGKGTGQADADEDGECEAADGTFVGSLLQLYAGPATPTGGPAAPASPAPSGGGVAAALGRMLARDSLVASQRILAAQRHLRTGNLQVAEGDEGREPRGSRGSAERAAGPLLVVRPDAPPGPAPLLLRRWPARWMSWPPPPTPPAAWWRPRAPCSATTARYGAARRARCFLNGWLGWGWGCGRGWVGRRGLRLWAQRPVHRPMPCAMSRGAVRVQVSAWSTGEAAAESPEAARARRLKLLNHDALRGAGALAARTRGERARQGQVGWPPLDIGQVRRGHVSDRGGQHCFSTQLNTTQHSMDGPRRSERKRTQTDFLGANEYL